MNNSHKTELMNHAKFSTPLQPTGEICTRKEHTGTETLENIAIPLRASINATSCGVETITAPVSQQKSHKIPIHNFI